MCSKCIYFAIFLYTGIPFRYFDQGSKYVLSPKLDRLACLDVPNLRSVRRTYCGALTVALFIGQCLNEYCFHQSAASFERVISIAFSANPFKPILPPTEIKKVIHSSLFLRDVFEWHLTVEEIILQAFCLTGWISCTSKMFYHRTTRVIPWFKISSRVSNETSDAMILNSGGISTSTWLRILVLPFSSFTVFLFVKDVLSRVLDF